LDLVDHKRSGPGPFDELVRVVARSLPRLLPIKGPALRARKLKVFQKRSLSALARTGHIDDATHGQCFHDSFRRPPGIVFGHVSEPFLERGKVKQTFDGMSSGNSAKCKVSARRKDNLCMSRPQMKSQRSAPGRGGL